MALQGLLAWAVFALMGLLFQAILFYKDAMATFEPRLKPALTVMCDFVGCQILPLQMNDAVLIDHASVEWVMEDSRALMGDPQTSQPHWRLQMSLRNSKKISVATPGGELTLTDFQDQALMRRVFDPATLGAPATLSPDETIALDWVLSLKVSDPPFVGYRLLTFYP
jgi:hypothetical protein